MEREKDGGRKREGGREGEGELSESERNAVDVLDKAVEYCRSSMVSGGGEGEREGGRKGEVEGERANAMQ